MARAIDSEVAYQFLTDQLVKETGAFSKGVNKGLNIARSAMRNQDAIPTLTPPNEPLTIEQLREMDGEPVWVALTDEKWSRLNGWYLVHHGNAYLARTDDWELDAEGYGVEWIAYRRPPEGEEREA